MKNKNKAYMEASNQMDVLQGLAKTIDMMAKRDANDVTLVPRNIELINDIIIVFENLKKDLLSILDEMKIDMEVNENTLKN
tara:strand:- start:16710 stop:16952 length:243 start_codon:yes stop_codon:yes gene_type:complete